MKITESKLRQIIRGVILAEAPLAGDGIYRYRDPSRHQTGVSWQDKSSIGYSYSEDPKWVEDAHLLMRNTTDNWAIVTLSHTEGAQGIVDSSEFKQWIREQHIPKGTRIIVVGDVPFSGDASRVAWSVGHDIFGHTLLQSTKGRSFIYNPTARRKIHAELPAEARLAVDDSDFLPDIYAAILLGIVDESKAVDMADEITKKSLAEISPDLLKKGIPDFVQEQHTQILTILAAMFNDVSSWVESITPDTPHVVKPWE